MTQLVNNMDLRDASASKNGFHIKLHREASVGVATAERDAGIR